MVFKKFRNSKFYEVHRIIDDYLKKNLVSNKNKIGQQI